MKSVAIYGHGASGRALAEKIGETKEWQVACFIDKRAEYLRSQYPNKKIYALEELPQTQAWQQTEAVLVSLENPELAEDICRQLEKHTEGKSIGYIPNNRLLGGGTLLRRKSLGCEAVYFLRGWLFI